MLRPKENKKEEQSTHNHSTFAMLKSLVDSPKTGNAVSTGLFAGINAAIVSGATSTIFTENMLVRGVSCLGGGLICGLFTCAICCIAPCICGQKSEAAEADVNNENSALISNSKPINMQMK